MRMQVAGEESMCEVETCLLLPHTVTNLAEFTAHPDRHLVSIEEDPGRAAKLWFERAAKNPYGGDGVVQIRYFGAHLVPPGAWDDTEAIWTALLDVLEGFCSTGAGYGLFCAEVTLVGNPHAAEFSVGGVSNRIEPRVFIPAVLDGAKRYFHWVENMVGRTHPGISERIEALAGLTDHFSPPRAPANPSAAGRSLDV